MDNKIVWENKIPTIHIRERIAIINEGVELRCAYRKDCGSYRNGEVPQFSWHPWLYVYGDIISPKGEELFDLRSAKKWCEEKLQEVAPIN
jgi:hypothetical protein